MKMRTGLITLTAGLVVGAVVPVHALTINSDGNHTDVDVYDTTGPELIAGDGISIHNFAQSSVVPSTTGAQSVSVAIKARDRDPGDTIGRSGSTAYIEPGLADDGTHPALAYDYQFDPGTDGSTNYQLQLDVDFDPAYGSTDFYTLKLPIFDTMSQDGWDQSDGYFTNSGTTNWNEDDVPYVVSNSGNLGFNFYGKSYDPNTPGQYEFRLTAFDSDGNTQLAQAQAFGVVTPTPAAAMVGLVGFGLMGMRRRRRQQA